MQIGINKKGEKTMKEKKLHLGKALMKTEKVSSLNAYEISAQDRQELRAAVSLQGLVNRYGAEIYIRHQYFSELDNIWLSDLEQYYEKVNRIGDREHPTDFYRLFDDYKDYVDGFIVFDPDSDYEWNIATTLAALEDSLPVTPAICEKLKSLGYDKKITDIRGRWKTKTDAYDYAISELLPKCACFGVLSQDPRGDHRFQDYGIACGLFCFWLNLEDETDLDIQRKIFNSGHFSPQPTVFGYAPQGDDLLMEGAPAGFGFIVSDWFGNASVCSSLPSAELPMQRPGVPVDAEDGKLYISIFFSDGDNIQFDQLGTRVLWNNMKKSNRSFPVGTTFAPMTAEIAPNIINWYYNNMHPEYDELIAGPSGWQFIYYGKYNREFLDGWLDKNDALLRRSGVRVANPWRFYPVEQKDDVVKYMEKTTCIDGALCEGITPDTCNAYIRGGKPVLLAEGNLNGKKPGDLEHFLRVLYKKVEESGGKPQFAAINTIVAWIDSKFSYIEEQMAKLPDDLKEKVVFLRPSDLVATFKKYADDNGLSEHI